jgi:hypothetical protein
MGLLGKLFGDDDLDRKAKGFFDDLTKSLQGQPQQGSTQPQQTQQPSAPAYSAPVQSNAPSGFSWGENMPAEENQFNSGLKYYEYFEKIYREEFPEYQVTKEFPYGEGRCVFTFISGSRIALKVEVMSQRHSVYKLRRDCQANGIGYTRFYHDHHGWWNTRRYVIERTRNAIK